MNSIGPITQVKTEKKKTDKPYVKKLLSALGLTEGDILNDIRQQKR